MALLISIEVHQHVITNSNVVGMLYCKCIDYLWQHLHDVSHQKSETHILTKRNNSDSNISTLATSFKRTLVWWPLGYWNISKSISSTSCACPKGVDIFIYNIQDIITPCPLLWSSWCYQCFDLNTMIITLSDLCR